MKKNNTFYLLLLIFLLLGVLSSADASTTIDPSRTTYLGRSLGLGGGGVALIDDGESLFLNPSGLAGIQFPHISGVSRKIFLDETAYSAYSFAFPTDYGVFGLGFVDANTGGSYATSVDNNNRITINPSLEPMTYDNNTLLFSYSRELKDIPYFKLYDMPLSVGGNLKFFNQSVSGGGVEKRGTGYNIDLGATYKALPWLKVGGTLQNVLGGNVKWETSQDSVGGFYKLGCAATILGSKESSLYEYPQEVVGVFDIDIPHDVLESSMLMHLGAEWAPAKTIRLRGGLNQETNGLGLTLGIGLVQEAFRFDYAYVQRSGIPGDNPHYFSLSYLGARLVTVDKKLKDKENAIKFLSPKDRHITSKETISILAEAKYNEILDQKTTWTVPIFSSTNEVKEIREAKDLQNVLLDMLAIGQTGTIEAETRPMSYGRHQILLTGMITPENTWVSSEIKVLRFDPFTDTHMSYWAIEPIALNSVLGLIKGYPDKTFRPEKGINRAELTALLVRTMNISPEVWGSALNTERFKDIPKTHWAAPYINIASDLGLVKGYPNGTFKPKSIFTRAEGVTVLSRYAKLPEKDFAPYPDLKEGFWANKHIYPAKEKGLLLFLEGKTFEATREFSRAEAAEVLYRTPQVQNMVNEYWEKGITPETGKTPEWMLKKEVPHTTKHNTIEAVEPPKPPTKEPSKEVLPVIEKK